MGIKWVELDRTRICAGANNYHATLCIKRHASENKQAFLPLTLNAAFLSSCVELHEPKSRRMPISRPLQRNHLRSCVYCRSCPGFRPGSRSSGGGDSGGCLVCLLYM